MRLPPDTHRHIDSAILLFLFALFLLASPLVQWWASDGSPWYVPYLIWFGILGLVAWMQRRRSS
ncbi:MAG: hypothetical protein WC383_13730 [Gammaproteobacteria bacterium]